jgi:hypothetical protein
MRPCDTDAVSNTAVLWAGTSAASFIRPRFMWKFVVDSPPVPGNMFTNHLYEVGQAFAMWAFFGNASGFEQVSTIAVNELTVTRPRSKTTFAQISPAMPSHSDLDSASRCNLLNSTWRNVTYLFNYYYRSCGSNAILLASRTVCVTVSLASIPHSHTSHHWLAQHASQHARTSP